MEERKILDSRVTIQPVMLVKIFTGSINSKSTLEDRFNKWVDGNRKMARVVDVKQSISASKIILTALWRPVDTIHKCSEYDF